MKTIAIIGVVLILSTFAAFPRDSDAGSEATPPPGTTSLYPSPNERFGIGVVTGIENFDVSPLGAGWYQNWNFGPDQPHPANIAVAHMVSVSPTGLRASADYVRRTAAVDPGGLWLVGNEPDMIRQDNVTPAQYAVQYHDAYMMIKAADPTARVSAAGIVEPTPLRLGWLSAVWDYYEQQYAAPMPVDVWNIHNYILQERPDEWGAGIPPGYYGERGQTYPLSSHDDLDIFESQIRAMRQWMADHDQQDKPLIITEYGILFPESSGFDLARVRQFFIDTASWMLTARDVDLGFAADDYHLVQAWLWYSLDDISFDASGNTVGGLMDPSSHSMRPMGQVYADFVSALRRAYVNLVLTQVAVIGEGGAAVEVGAEQTVIVKATVRNLGNFAASQPFQVTISDQSGHVIYSQVIQRLRPRYEEAIEIAATWQKPAGANWHLTLRVDPENTIAESDENDNTTILSLSADLSVSDLRIGDESAEALYLTGQVPDELDLSATIANSSRFDITGSRIRLWDGTTLVTEQAAPQVSGSAQVETTIRWIGPTRGAHRLTLELIPPVGMNDPFDANNRIISDIILGERLSFLPAISGPLPSSGPVGISCRIDVVQNPSFETGSLTSWNSTKLISLMSSSCFDGQYCAWMGRGLNIEDRLSQLVTVPAGASADLTFGWAVVTAETGATKKDSLAIEVLSSDGTLLSTVQSLTNVDAQPYWSTSSLNLNQWAGRSIYLQFRAKNDTANPTNFFVDKVQLEVCERD